MTVKAVDQLWEKVKTPVLNTVKIFFLERYTADILTHFHKRLEYVIHKYARHLPRYVAESEIEDLRTISQLELLETIKVWNSSDHDDIWPLAHVRIVGAMKDHIRYITRSDPSRFYSWITDAAYMYMTMNKRADFQEEIETGVELGRAMKVLTERERKIVLMHAKEDATFKVIGDHFGISESQISRIYKAAINKVKKQLK